MIAKSIGVLLVTWTNIANLDLLHFQFALRSSTEAALVDAMFKVDAAADGKDFDDLLTHDVRSYRYRCCCL